MFKLFSFCRHKSTEAVKVLQQRGADPTIPDNENATPLLFAARQAYTEIAALLLNDPRTNVNYANSAKITPFLSACASGDKSLCELLLARGAELTAKSTNLTTALHCAAYGGHVEICELLISKGIKPLIIIMTLLRSAHTKGLVPATSPGDQVPSCELPIFVKKFSRRDQNLVPATCPTNSNHV